MGGVWHGQAEYEGDPRWCYRVECCGKRGRAVERALWEEYAHFFCENAAAGREDASVMQVCAAHAIGLAMTTTIPVVKDVVYSQLYVMHPKVAGVALSFLVHLEGTWFGLLHRDLSVTRYRLADVVLERDLSVIDPSVAAQWFLDSDSSDS